jgi:hypothetical protein
MHLWCHVYVSRPLFAAEHLDALQAVINELMPDWSRSLRVEFRGQMVIVGRDGRLSARLPELLPRRFPIGRAELMGLEASPSVYLGHSDSSLPIDSNRVCIEVYRIASVEGRKADAWAREIFTALTSKLPVRYGNVRLTEEYDAKNMVHTQTSTSAIGVQFHKYLPGLYWLNYFGPPYCDLMGRDRILTVPAYEVWPSGDGVIVSLAESAEEWESPAYRRREQDVIEHLGKPYFFSRDDPKRDSLAPDFDAIRKREGPQ